MARVEEDSVRWYETFPWYTVGTLVLALATLLAGAVELIPAEYAVVYSGVVATIGALGRALVMSAERSESGAMSAIIDSEGMVSEDEISESLGLVSNA